MPDYTITTHVELPGKPEPVRSGLIRLRIPADSELEAKAERYILNKLTIVIDSCQEDKPAPVGPIGFPFGQAFYDALTGKKP
jgi:hypothetical protein